MRGELGEAMLREAAFPGAAAYEPPVRPDYAARAPMLYRGWYVVAGAFLVLMVGFGAIYSYAAFAEQITAEFGSTRASVSLVFALSGGSCFLVSALSGPLADRVGARVMAATGMLLVGLGLAITAAAKTLIEVYVGYGLLTGLGTGFAYVPAMAAVQRWFVAHRGLASGIAVSGIGIGTALVPPATDALVFLGDWRAAFVASGALAALIGVAGAMLLAPAPAGVARMADAGHHAPPRGRDLGLAYAGLLLLSVPASLPHAMLVATARDLGLPWGEAVALLGLIGLGTIAGRFLLAALADVLGRRATLLGCAAGMAASMAVWAVAGEIAVLQGFALGFGALQGGFVALMPAFVADSFGARSLGGTLGLLYTSRGIGLIAAPPALAFGIAAMGGHGVPLLGAAVLGAVGVVLLGGVRR